MIKYINDKIRTSTFGAFVKWSFVAKISVLCNNLCFNCM